MEKSKSSRGYLAHYGLFFYTMETRVFRYRMHIGKEIKRERWVDQEVNLPDERRHRRSTCNQGFCYRLLFGDETSRKRWVDREVNHPDERRPRRSMETRVFRYRMHIGKEIKRERWVDQEVNHPDERRPRRSTCNPGFFVTVCILVKKQIARGGLTRRSTFRKNDVLVVPLATQSFSLPLTFR